MDGLTKFKGVLASPRLLYAKVRNEGYLPPWIFYVVVAAISLTVSILVQLPSIILQVINEPELNNPAGVVIFLVIFCLMLALILVMQAGLVFVTAGIMHLFLMLVGAKKGYLETFKLICYSQAPAVFVAPFAFLQIIPIAGPMLYFVLAFAAWVWSAIIQVNGAVALHQITMGRAVIALIVIPLVLLAIVVVMVVLFFTALVYYADMSSVTGYIINSVV